MKQTIQTLEILDFLKNNRIHPKADIIYENVKKKIPTITLATVYRVLNKLVEKGEVIKIEFNNQSYFDYNFEDHTHFICEKCGKIYDINLSLEPILDEISKKTGHEIKKYSLIFYGICKRCKNE